MNDNLLEKFDEIEKTHWWWEGRRELVKILLSAKRPKRILDVGCGTGETLSFLHTLFPKAQLWGVDTSAKAISYAKSRGHKNIIKVNGGKLPFKDGFFDVVLFLDVLEHIKNDQAAIDEAKRVLKPKGNIVITSPGLQFIWSDHDSKQGHIKRYTRREIKNLAKNGQLKTKFISYFNFFFCPPIIAVRLLSRLSMFRSFADYDRGINFDIAKIGPLNGVLKNVFTTEIRALRYVRYPIGISIAANLEK